MALPVAHNVGAPNRTCKADRDVLGSYPQDKSQHLPRVETLCGVVQP